MKEIRETARGLQWGRCWREGIAIKIEKEREKAGRGENKRSIRRRGCESPEAVPFSSTNLIALLRQMWVASS